MSVRWSSSMVVAVLGFALGACSARDVESSATIAGSNAEAQSSAAVGWEPLVLTDEQWRARLTPDQYDVLRESGTERAFSGALYDAKSSGSFRCSGCGLALFDGDTKFDSGTGWPSFWTVHAPGHVATEVDRSWLGIARTEVHCARCGGHLGHVFDDGPEPTGLRYCINSAALVLDEQHSPVEHPVAPVEGAGTRDG